MNPPDEPKGVGAPGTGIASIKGAIDKVSRRLGGGGMPPPSPPSGDGEDEEDDGMLRMSFLEHLEELRSRIFRALGGVGIAFVVSLTFSKQLWDFVRQPAVAALTSLGYGPDLVMIEPMEAFNIIWFKVPIVCAIFL